MKFSGMCVGPAVSSIVALVVMGMLAACHVTEQDGDVKDFADADEPSEDQAKDYMSTHCNQLGTAQSSPSGGKSYTYKHEDKVRGQECSIPVTITATGLRYMQQRQVSCGVVRNEDGTSTGELQLEIGGHNASFPYNNNKSLYNTLKIGCSTKSIHIDGKFITGNKELRITVNDNVVFYKETLKNFLEDYVDGITDENKKVKFDKALRAGGNPNKPIHIDEMSIYERLKDLGFDQDDAKQLLKLMYITKRDYVESNTYPDIASRAQQVLDDATWESEDKIEHRTVSQNLIYGLDSSYFGMTRQFYKYYMTGDELWFTEGYKR